MARPGLRNHPKFLRLMHMLSEPESYVRGYLECLWDVAYECGNPEIGDATDMKLACKGMHDDAKMQNLLFAFLHCGGPGRAGFIEEVTGSSPIRYQIHDLFDHAPEYVQRRMGREHERRYKGVGISEVRRAAAMSRWGKKNANDMQTETFASGQYANGATPAPAPAPAPAPMNIYADAKAKHANANTLPEPDPLRAAARDQFGQWAAVERGHGLDETAGEHRHVHELLDTAAKLPPIPRGGGVVPRQTLVPLAAETCRKNQKPFKGIKYACKIVATLLDEWALKGMPGDQNGAAPVNRFPTAMEREQARVDAMMAAIESDQKAEAT